MVIRISGEQRVIPVAGGWPTAATTGTSGTLTSGTVDYNASGVTYNNLNVTNASTRDLVGSNNTFNNCHFNSATWVISSTGNTFNNCTFTQNITAASSSNMTLYRCKITGYDDQDGMHITSDRGTMCDNILIQECYSGSPTATSGNHVDALQVRGSTGLHMIGNYFHQGNTFSSLFNAALFLEEANGGNSGFLIEDNYFKGGGWWTTYLDGTGTFRNNTLDWPNDGTGLIFNTNTFPAGITAYGNVDGSGNPI